MNRRLRSLPLWSCSSVPLASILVLTGAVACSSSSTGSNNDNQTHHDASSSTDSGNHTKTDGETMSGDDSGSQGDDSGGDDAGDDSGGGDDAGDDDGGGDDAGDDSGDDAGDDAGGSGDSGTTAATCSTGTLFAGDPTYSGDPSNLPTSGTTGIHADPPLQWQNLVFSGTLLYTHVAGELWYTDLSAASPVETRAAGMNDSSGNYAYGAGPCTTALFADIRDLGVLSDGSVVVADYLGNGILHVTNPTTSACNVEYWAGNATSNDDIDPTEDLPNTGDADGAGSAAMFNGPGSLVVDGSGNVFFYDIGNSKIRQVGTSTPYTTKTLATIPQTSNGTDTIYNMTVIGSAIYAIAGDQVDAYVLRIDTATGAVTTVLQGDGSAFPPLDSTVFPELDGIATDGTGLYLAGNGYVWYLTTAGVIHVVAGTGVPVDFPPSGYDPTASHSAMSLALPPSSSGASIDVGSSDFIAFHSGALYFRGQGDGAASFIERIACP